MIGTLLTVKVFNRPIVGYWIPCTKVAHGVECYKCGYPYSEAMYPDSDPPMGCTTHGHTLREYISTYILNVKPTERRVKC